MADKASYGVTSLAFGPVGADGGYGDETKFVQFNEIAPNTLSVVQAAATKTEFPIDTSISPFLVIYTPGALELKATVYIKNPEQLVFMFGGTITTTGTGAAQVKTYTSNDTVFNKEVSGKINAQSGQSLKLVRCQLNAVLNLVFGKTDLWKIDISASVLDPANNAISSYSIDFPA